MEDLFDVDATNQRQEPVLDVTSHAFQPKKYIQRVLAGVPHAIFEGELVDKVGQAEEDTGEALKQLIRDNLAVFVNSKDAMDAVYHSDQELFTGEALDGITNSFKSATGSCDALVQPITATFVEVQKSRKSQDMLDKLFSVLGVPGAIYGCCGVKVASRRAATIGALGTSDTSDIEKEDGDAADGEGAAAAKEDEEGEEGEEGERDRSRSHNEPQDGPRRKTASSQRGGAPNNDDSNVDDEEEEDEDEDDEAGDDRSDRDVEAEGRSGPGRPSTVHGTLENPGGTTNLAQIFVFTQDEEIYSWYGTPLVRLRDVDARRHHVEEVSNYETAILNLRRAMLYVEETYSLMDGTMLAGEDGDVPRPTPPPAAAAVANESRGAPSPGGHAGPTSGTPSPAPPQTAATATTTAAASTFSTARRSTFAFKFALALLRSALYLCRQLAEELVYANPADTVLIEDTLSMMMDASIATVKLRHLCGVLQQSMEPGQQQRNSLTKLRTQLSAAAAAAATTATNAASGASPLREPVNSNPFGAASPNNISGVFASASSSAFDSFSPASGNTSSATAGVTRARRRTAAYLHPAQYFISIVQRQHRHLFHSSATALLQEANAWMWKAQTDAARGLEERHRQREQQRKVRAAAANGVDTAEDAASPLGTMGTLGHNFANSFMGASVAADGGFIGNSKDSFSQDTSFGWVNRRGGNGQSSRAGGSDAALQSLGASNGGTGRSSSNAGAQPQHASLVPEMFVARVLDAFNTPESPFSTTTEFKVGTSDMDAVLLSSCLQVRMHAASLLSQLFTHADVESAVMAQATSLNTFALRLCAECVGTLEHVVGSYWGGIATTLHAGVFDFVPDGTLKDMLAELLEDDDDGEGEAAGAATAIDVNGLQRSPSTTLGSHDGGGVSTMHSRIPSALDRSDSHQRERGDAPPTAGNVDGSRSADTRIAGMGSSSSDPLPHLRFIPTLQQALQKAPAKPHPSVPPRPASLRDISIQAVHQMISAAANTLLSLFITFINKGVVDGFVGTMARYRVSDAARYSRNERMELHAAVLYEVLLGQWERMMSLVSDSVLRLKIVMAESSSSATINSDSQVEEVGNLLQELEVLRSTCLRTYLHGVGVLSKAYLTMLPLLQRRTDTSLDTRVRSRVSRDSVSSSVVHKLLNVLAVVVDRCVPFFTRDAEVFDSVDLFSVKAENLLAEDDDDDHASRGGRGGVGGSGRGGVAGRRLRVMRSRRGGATGTASPSSTAADGSRRPSSAAAINVSPAPSVGGPDTATDPVSAFLAQFHSKLVMESLQDHEEVVLALLSHLLLAFVDMLQLKCRTATTDGSVAPEERERSVVECMADTLSLATTLTPILMEHLLSPCFFELLARQLPEVASNPAEVAAYLQNKQQQYVQTYLSVVEEHCQLAVDAMMNTYLALAQQPITDLVRRQGFVQPLFDWQRVSPHTTAAVRPYIADAIACIARAHETLNAIRQPILGSAATQRLIAHLARVFLTSFTSDINVFELSVECSTNFLVLGLTLLEAEALTILKVVDSVMDHAAANPASSELSTELVLARESLSTFAPALGVYANSVCETITATYGREGASEAALAVSFLARDKRQERRDSMVQAAVHTLGYTLEAINVELEESSLSSAGLLQMRSSVTESIVQRLEHRNEGYEMRRAKAAQKEQERKDAEKRASSAASGRRKKATAAAGVDTAEEAEGTAGRRRVVRRRPDELKPLVSTDTDVAGEDAGGAVLTPRTAQENKETSSAIAAASNVFQLAQDQQHRTKGRKVRKVRKAAVALDEGAATDAAAPTSETSPSPLLAAAGAAATTAKARVTPPTANRGGNDADDAEAPLRLRSARRPRRGAAASASAEADSVAEPHERRANRFRRSNVV
ncbi:hypothetical protein ABB37_07093 [Leptomonas pyrrhocoris]|uniref:Uncharacterized protein n=1 Tax=Leptomonas pyrrhocoris TaxID=157538 RepID=A0A0M9FW30_LEPPY|nr:hypothetical protein ABB37_07093 [Leptomonas pyrrhocoris]KPA77173.1 hypothetical protein ABB37_07093 [Leptomonas pyrrhocoris]|eukprot:XP_015655612.1 hypothetical protein ABB37_07093 [Leptomonas pyrrhocoris]